MFDPAEYEKTVGRYSRPLLGYCFIRLGRDLHSAEEVVDDVFVALFRKWDKLDRAADLRPWLYRAADILIKNRLRRRAKDGYSVSLEEVLERDASPTPSDVDKYFEERYDDERLLRSVADRLPERYREIFSLRYIDGKILSDIVGMTGVPYSSVRRRIVEMEPLLRRLIDETGEENRG